MNISSSTGSRAASKITLSTAVLLAAALAGESHAAISGTTPNPGDTVTVDTADPNPYTGTLNFTGTSNVTVEVQNGALWNASGNYALVTGDGFILNNNGTMSAGFTTIGPNGGGTINNFGTITGGSNAAISSGPNVVNLDNQGTITGDVQGGNASSFTNAGILTGNWSISVGSAANTLTITPTATINGYYDPGTGTDTLTLGGDSGSGSLDLNDVGDGLTYRNFETFTKEGDSTWTLTGTNANNWTVSGGTLIVNGSLTGINTFAGGTVVAGGDTALGTNALVITGNAALQSDNDARSLANNINISNTTLTINGDDDLTLTGLISGSGTLAKDGSGTLTLGGVQNSTFSGDIDVQGGTLNIANSQVFSTGNDLNLADTAGATFELNDNVAVGDITGGGSNGGNIELNSYTLFIGTNDSGSAYAGVISGTGNISKTGAQTQTFSGNNTYSGGTSMIQGTLGLGHDNALGTGSLTITGTSAIQSTDDARSVANNIAINSTTLTVNGDNDLALTGVVSGAGKLAKAGGGTLTLTGNNTYTSGTDLFGGTLVAGSDTALGTQTLLTMGDGTLQSNNDARSLAVPVFINPSDTLTVNGSNDLELSGALAGTGTLAKDGAGTLVLSGTGSTFTGDVDVNGGTLAIGNVFNTGVDIDLANAAGVTLRVDQTVAVGDLTGGGANGGNVELGNHLLSIGADETSTYAGLISGTGSIRKQAGGSLTLTGNNTYTGGTLLFQGDLILGHDNALGIGTLTLENTGNLQSTDDSRSIDNAVAISSGHTLTVNGSHDLTLTGVVSGAGNLTKAGAADLTLTGTNTYTGDTTLSAGRLIINGSLVSDVTQNAGTLMGSGSVGDLSVAGGNVAPGNSIGTLTVNGDFSLDAAGTYDVEIDGDGTTDRIAATGTATLADGSTIHVTVAGHDSLIKQGDQWTILEADGGVTDLGADITTDFAGFSFTRDFSATQYWLIAKSDDLADDMTSPTALAVATALDADRGSASTDLSDFITTVGNQTGAQADQTLAANTPQAVGATQVAQNRSTQRFQAGLGNYLQGRRLGMPQLSNQTPGIAPNASFQIASAAAGDPTTLAAYFAQADTSDADGPERVDFFDPATNTSDAARWGGFASVYGVYSDRDAEAGTAGSQATTYAGQIGLDYQINDRWLMGLSFGYGEGEIEMHDNLGGDLGENDTDTVRVGPYVGFADGPWSIDASLTVGFHGNDATRRNPGTGDTFTADYDSQDIAAYLGGAYAFDVNGWTVGPHAGLQYVHTWVDDYQEAGPGGALSVDEAEFDSLRATVGLGVSRLFEVGSARLMPRAEVGYAHEFLDDDDLTARFVGGNNAFTLASATADEDSVYYGAGVTALFDATTSLDLSYYGETSGDQQTDAIRLTLRLEY